MRFRTGLMDIYILEETHIPPFLSIQRSSCCALGRTFISLDLRPSAYHWHSLTTSLLEAETNRTKIVLSLSLSLSRLFLPSVCGDKVFSFWREYEKKQSREHSKGHHSVTFSFSLFFFLKMFFLASKLYFTKICGFSKKR